MISIIIPIYNRLELLEKTLQSIENQTYSDVEVIIIDDNSKPAVKERIQFTGYKLQIYLFTLDINKGANHARNFGFSKSKGEYVIFWDHDLVGKSEMLSTMYDTLQNNPKASYTYASYYLDWKGFRLWPFSATRLRRMPYIHTTSLIRREHFPGFDESLKRLQDWDLWLTILGQGHTGVYIPKYLSRSKSGGTMSTWLPKYVYMKPFKYFLPSFIKKRVKQYENAVSVIREKHNL